MLSPSPPFARSFPLSRRRRETHATDSPPDPLRGERFRRYLLGAITALIVARPLAAGEDPGRLLAPESVSGLILNSLWLMVALAGAVWLAFSARPFRLGGWISVCLVGVVGFMFLSTARSDGYRAPGWLIACEWGLIPIIFMLTREVTTDPDEESDSAGGLLAAILATAVSVAGFAVYQSIADAAGWKISELPLSAATPVPPGDDLRDLLAPTSELDWTVRGTFERSDTLFAFLLLLIPSALLYGFRDQSLKARFALAAALLIVAAWLLAGNDFLRSSFAYRLKTGWTVALRMTQERPAFGVGPGNFDRNAPPLLSESAPYSLSDAWGSYPEIAATCGIAVLIAILAASIWVLIAIARKSVGPSPNPPPPPEDRLVGWEFFIGGAVGLFLGLLLRVLDMPGAEEPKTILHAVYGAVGRALIWFVAFACFDGARLNESGRRKAILAGLVFVFLFGAISGALLRPALFQMVWIVAALALHSKRTLGAEPRPHLLIRALPMEVALLATAAYSLLVVYPEIRTAELVTHAHRAAYIFNHDRMHADAEAAVSAKEKLDTRTREKEFLERQIVLPLMTVVRDQPAEARKESGFRQRGFNSPLCVEAAGWLRLNWKLAPNLSTKQIIELVQQAEKSDPHNVVPFVREFQLRANFATFSPNVFEDPTKLVEYTQKIRNDQFKGMDELIPKILERDPSMDLRLRYRAIQAMFESREEARFADAKLKTLQLQQDDEAESRPRWKLTREQRRRLEQWLHAK